MNLLEFLRRNRFVNSFIKYLRVDRLLTFYLSLWPLKRQTASGLFYKIESAPALVVANEIFKVNCYQKAIQTLRPSTFIDLGSNAGYFPVAVADTLEDRTVRGLCIEPDPSLYDSNRFHIKENKLENVLFCPGAVGKSGGGEMVDFFINPSDIASSLNDSFNPLVPTTGKVKKIKIPLLDISKEWEARFPDTPIDLLKVDIEGAEIIFFQSHALFLLNVKAIVIEWHKWVTNLAEVTAVLKGNGIVLREIYEEDCHAGTALFSKAP